MADETDYANMESGRTGTPFDQGSEPDETPPQPAQLPSAQETASPRVTILNPDGRPLKAQETWPREDWLHVTKAIKYCNSRQVYLHIRCQRCNEALMPNGVDGDGSTIIACGCTERVWRV